jgi:hypothetical protein
MRLRSKPFAQCCKFKGAVPFDRKDSGTFPQRFGWYGGV